jgi:hypothetical protein
MRASILNRLSVFSVVAASLITLASSYSASAAPAVMGTISGTITAGGNAVPSGSVQVVFVKYNKTGPNPACLNGQPAAPSINLIGVPVGANGVYSQSLDTSFNWKIIFKPLSNAPRTALFRWYASGAITGTTVGYHPSAPVQATCITTLTTAGLSNINLSTTGSSMQIKGTIKTSSGAAASNVGIQVTRTGTCYFQLPDGYASRSNEAGEWEIAGIDVNQNNQYLQVVSPAGNCSGLYFAKKVGNSYELINAADLAACGDACKFNFTTVDLSSISLQLPVIGEISGVVSGPSGPVGAGKVCVTAFKDGGTAMNYYSFQAGSACTDSSGRYTLGLMYDNYRLQFISQPGSPFKSEWYDNVTVASGYTSSTSLCVKASGDGCSTSKTADATLAEGKSISGRVVDSTGGIENVTVHAMSISSMGGYMGIGYSRTDSSGNYTIYGLDDGSYTLMFSHEDFGQQWLGGSRENSQTFQLTSSIVGKNVTLSRGSKISGVISTGDGSEGRICVNAYKITDTNMGWGEHAGGACFTAPGQWAIKGLKDGNYRLRFDAQSGNLRSTFLGGTEFTEATQISVSGADVPNLSITIPTGKSISGRVSDVVKNEWVGSACVTAWLQKDGAWGYGAFAGSSCTDTKGEFNIRGLAEGTYLLQMNPPGNTDLSPGWYHDSGTPTRSNSSATPILITNSSSLATTTTTQSMQTGPKITAKIVNGSSSPVPGICVDAIKITNDAYGWGEWGANSCSGPDGLVSLRGLVPGNYKFRVNANSGDYQSGWIKILDSTTTTAQSGVTSLSLGSESIALGNITLSTGKKAFGKIVSSGNPVSGACIGAMKVSTGNPWGEWSGSACTQANGEFTIRGLDPVGEYLFRIDIWQGDYKPGFLANNGSMQSSPTGITARPATSNIDLSDIELPTAPSIKGTVYSGLTTKESNVCINAHLATTYQWISSSCTQSNGTYALRGLDPSTDYKISWWTQKPLLTNGWYKSVVSGSTQVQNAEEADPITVPTGGLTGIDIRIASGGSITGSLTADFCVAAWLTSESSASPRENASSTACADSEGLYELKGLLPNTDYFLQVFKIDGSTVTSQSPNGDSAKRTGTSSSVNITAS